MTGLGLIGQKIGMTRVFTETGDSIPVTVLAVEPNRVTQLKTLDNDGYFVVQLTTSFAPRGLHRGTRGRVINIWDTDRCDVLF